MGPGVDVGVGLGIDVGVGLGIDVGVGPGVDVGVGPGLVPQTELHIISSLYFPFGLCTHLPLYPQFHRMLL